MENCSLALRIPEYGSEAMEIARRIYDRRVVPRGGRQGRLAEALVQDPPAPH